jgi:MFS family permease
MVRPPPLVALTLATFLTLVPVTLLVPGLNELVVVAHQASEAEAHAFMAINMLAGMAAVPVVMRLLPRLPSVRGAIIAVLLLDAAAFAGMAVAQSLPSLFVFRIVEGTAHLPAVTLLMVASNRFGGERRGAALGAVASAIMVGVAVGSPLGGWLVGRGSTSVYVAGAVLLVCAAIVAALLGPVPAQATARSRYAWNRTLRVAWIPLGYAFLDRFTIGIFVSTFTLFLANHVGVPATERGLLIALFMAPFALMCYPAGRVADRFGWFVPIVLGNALFGAAFASYGIVPRTWLPLAMVVSGVLSAFMFAPSLLLVSELSKRGAGEGLFGAFQLAGSFGFLVGPIVGGALVTLTAGSDGVPQYRAILAGVGLITLSFAGVSFAILRPFAAQRGTSVGQWVADEEAG